MAHSIEEELRLLKAERTTLIQQSTLLDERITQLAKEVQQSR
jgi:hypothetical protein